MFWGDPTFALVAVLQVEILEKTAAHLSGAGLNKTLAQWAGVIKDGCHLASLRSGIELKGSPDAVDTYSLSQRESDARKLEQARLSSAKACSILTKTEGTPMVGLAIKIKEEIEAAAALAKDGITIVRNEHTALMQTEVKKLTEKVASMPGLVAFSDHGHEASCLEDIIENYVERLKDVPAEELLDAGTHIMRNAEQIDKLGAEFDLPKDGDACDQARAEIKSMRVLCITKQMLDKFSDSALVKQKAELRKVAQGFQAKIREYKFDKTDLNAHVNEKYLSALRMR